MVWAPLYGLGTFFTSCKSLVPLNLFSLWLCQKLYPQYDVKPSRQLSHKTIPARWAVLPTKVVRNLKYFGHGFTTTAPTCASGQHVMLSHCLLQPGEKRKADEQNQATLCCLLYGAEEISSAKVCWALVRAPFVRKDTEIFCLNIEFSATPVPELQHWWYL